MAFIGEDFLLSSATARRLYYEYAQACPIIDYHCHLPVKQIADDYRFADAAELFLGGDHYKWRQMRSDGIDEEYITGGAPGYEKFVRWADVLPRLIGNPLYHWTALELERYFGVHEPLCPANAEKVWEHCNKLLADDSFSARNLIKRSGVEVICTTDDPSDDLRYHEKIASDGFGVRVLPTFRPDKLVEINSDAFIPYIQKTGIQSYDALMSWIDGRIDYFASHGCRVADHGLSIIPYAEGDARAVLEKRLNGGTLTENEADVYRTALIARCAAGYSRLNWAMQIHTGAMRNNNAKMFSRLGADAGFDSVGMSCRTDKLSRLLDKLESDGILPRTVLYNLNPADNYCMATMAGNFQSAPNRSKIQFGAGWWFCDHRDGMERQLCDLATLGVLGNFIGMLTDSRSFVSYPRHEYFRRILCNLIGQWVENGEYPDDDMALAQIVRGICHDNAKEFFGF